MIPPPYASRHLSHLALAALLLFGCGASAASIAAPNSDPLASHNNDPRSADPTAVQPGSTPLGTTGTAVAVGKAPPSPASPNAPAGKPPAESENRGTPSRDDAAAKAGLTAGLTPSTAGGTGSAGAGRAATEETAPKKISARHVLVQWMGTERAGKSVLRTREQAMVLVQEVQRRAKAGDDLGRLAVEYSDEPNAGTRGGSIGRFGKGAMAPAFETAAFKLKVGEISDIVETQFGFHIIQRTE